MLETELPPGSVAYVDSDWLPTSSGDVPALVAAPGGAFAWCGGRAVRMPGDLDSDTAAILALLAVARAAAAALECMSPNMIEIVGNGLIAQQVRALVGERSAAGHRSPPNEQPEAIVDTTGDPDVIVDATRRVADLGTVVLLGESHGRTAELNLYPDVHVRGLRLVGVAAPLEHSDAPFAEADPGDSLVESCREELVGVQTGTPFQPASVWYRVSG